MSAVVGIVQFDGTQVESDLLKQMVQRMAHRGPDAQTVWVNQNVGLGHALYRTNKGDIQQPFTLGHVTISAHVRIDARDDLIPRLRKAGIEARLDAPDVELLAQAYLVWGEACLNYLFGDFAFILWDAEKRNIFAARDHFGTQSLYYARLGDSLIISTDIGAIRLHPRFNAKLNDQAVGDFLVLGDVSWIDKSQTIFTDISRIPPAHCLRTDREQISVQRYWMPPIDDPMLRYRREDEYVDHFLDIFKQAVKDRMRSRRIMIPLSGGMDSTSIAVMACKLIRSGEVNADLNAMTQVLDRTHPVTEAFYAELVARKLGLPHFIVPGDAYRLREPLPLKAEPSITLRSGAAELIGWTASLLGQIGLRGEGGDEVLYPEVFADILKGLPPRSAGKLLLWKQQSFGTRATLGELKRAILRRKRASRALAAVPSWLNPEFERQFRLNERYQQLRDWQPPQRHPLHPLSYARLLWPDWQMSGEWLHRQQVTPPTFTAPFLDRRLIRFTLSLPPQPWFRAKYLLRRAMRDDLPQEILTRHKTPLGMMIETLLLLPETEWVDQWQPVPELKQYVLREAIPPLTGSGSTHNASIDIRPLMLNIWLSHYCEI